MAGVGGGSHLKLTDVFEDGVETHPYPTGGISHPGPHWHPVVAAGYFYIRDEEYYCYAKKVSLIGYPDTVTGELPFSQCLPLPETSDSEATPQPLPVPQQGAPIVVTDGYPAEFGTYGYLYPFAKTYEPPIGASGLPRTPNKFRKRIDLTDRRFTTITASGTYNDYDFTLGDNDFTIEMGTANEAGHYDPLLTFASGNIPSQITVEYEGADNTDEATIYHVDLNPANSPLTTNTFLTISDIDTEAEFIKVDMLERYPLTTDFHHKVRAVLDTGTGKPVRDRRVHWWAEGDSGLGVFTDEEYNQINDPWTVTAYDGSSVMRYSPPPIYWCSPSGITIWAAAPDASGYCKIHPSVLPSGATMDTSNIFRVQWSQLDCLPARNALGQNAWGWQFDQARASGVFRGHRGPPLYTDGMSLTIGEWDDEHPELEKPPCYWFESDGESFIYHSGELVNDEWGICEKMWHGQITVTDAGYTEEQGEAFYVTESGVWGQYLDYSVTPPDVMYDPDITPSGNCDGGISGFMYRRGPVISGFYPAERSSGHYTIGELLSNAWLYDGLDTISPS